MKTLLIVGAGTMGTGIAQTAARSGCRVHLYDIDSALVEKGLGKVRAFFVRQQEKASLSEADCKAAVARVSGLSRLSDAPALDVVIEAAVENMDIKKKIFRQLDETLPPETLLATNTSSLSVTEIATVTQRWDKVIGLHFFNPVPVMGLVEIIRGVATSEQTYAALLDLCHILGKTAVSVREAPGFVVNRILIPMVNEAAFILDEGVATAEDIDVSMKLGCNHPIGPLALGDLIGLDVCLAIMEILHTELGDGKYRPAPLLRKMVRAGFLGRKSGRGFFSYG